MTHWSKSEEKVLRELSTLPKIQNYLNDLTYNASDFSGSPRMVIKTQKGHCFEGALLAAAALEFHGAKPLVVNLYAHHDDNHILTVVKTQTGWGSLSKSNTTLLRGRMPIYKTVRELVMSYFDFYFNTKGQFALHSYTSPVNLNRFKNWDWRTSEKTLSPLSEEISILPHHSCVDLKTLKSLPKVGQEIKKACFLGADPKGLYPA